MTQSKPSAAANHTPVLNPLIVMQAAEAFLTKPVMASYQEMPGFLDSARVQFSQHKNLSRLRNMPHLSLARLVALEFLPPNLVTILPVLNRSDRQHMAEVLHKDVSELTLRDLHSLPCVNEKRLEVAATIIVAQAWRNVLGKKNISPSKNLVANPDKFGLRVSSPVPGYQQG